MFSKLRSLIFKFDPETAHDLAIKSLKFNLIPNIFDENKNDPMFKTNLFGKQIENPIGLAAGFDKNAEVYNSLFRLGFGFVEAGTVTQEISGGSYSRVQVTSWDSPSNGATQNTSDVTFPTSSADWGMVSGVFIADASSGGNVLLHGSLTSSRDVKNGDVFKFNAGDLDITFA